MFKENTHASLHALPDFTKTSEIEGDGFGVEIRAISMKGGRLDTYWMEQPWTIQLTKKSYIGSSDENIAVLSIIEAFYGSGQHKLNRRHTSVRFYRDSFLCQLIQEKSKRM